MIYNTSRPDVKLKEYGRSIEEMANHLFTIEDREKRNSMSRTLVDLMKMINPDLKDSQEYDQKVWDDLHYLTDYKLEVDSPYPVPVPEILNSKPQRVRYQSNTIKYKHYGRSLEILIENASKLDNKEEQTGAILTIGRLMKTFYQGWNKEYIEDEHIAKTIKEMSNGRLQVDLEKIKELGLFEQSFRQNREFDPNRQPRNNNYQSNRNFHKGKRNNFKKRRNHSN